MELLTALWPVHSTRAIAAEFERVFRVTPSRTCILGKAHRMKLPAKESPIRKATMPREKDAKLRRPPRPDAAQRDQHFRRMRPRKARKVELSIEQRDRLRAEELRQIEAYVATGKVKVVTQEMVTARNDELAKQELK